MKETPMIRAWIVLPVAAALTACAGLPGGTSARPTWPDVVVHLHTLGKAYLVDPRTDAVVAALDTSVGGNLGSTTPDGRWIYVGAEAVGQNTITVLDLKERKVAKRITTGNRPKHPQVSPDGKWVMINHWGLDGGKLRVTFIDTGTQSIARTIEVDVAGTPAATTPTSMHNSWSTDSRWAFTVDRVDQNLLVVDTRNWSLRKLKMPSQPHYPVPSPDGKELWMVVEGRGRDDPAAALVFDLTQTGMPQKARVNLPLVNQTALEGHHGNFTQDGRHFYMLNRGPGNDSKGTEVAVYDAATKQMVARVETGSTGVGHTYNTPDGRYAVVTNYGNNVISIIDAKTMKLVKDIPIGKGRMGHVAFTPDSRWGYVSNAGDGNLHKIDMAQLALVKEITTGGAPGGAQVLNVWTGVFEELPR
jgi:YVTN family beta-propeller protein